MRQLLVWAYSWAREVLNWFRLHQRTYYYEGLGYSEPEVCFYAVLDVYGPAGTGQMTYEEILADFREYYGEPED